jgi:hypothetical protein
MRSTFVAVEQENTRFLADFQAQAARANCYGIDPLIFPCHSDSVWEVESLRRARTVLANHELRSQIRWRQFRPLELMYRRPRNSGVERIAIVSHINQTFGKSQFGLIFESDATNGAWRQQNLSHPRCLIDAAPDQPSLQSIERGL